MRFSSFTTFVFVSLITLTCACKSFAAFFFPKTEAQLIAAITRSNTNGENDAIDLGDNTFTLTRINNRFNGLPPILPDNGHTLLIRRGIIERSTDAGIPIFRFLELFPNAKVTLDLVTLRNGVVAGDANGGALSVGKRASLSVTNCIFDNNTSGNGGGAMAASAQSRIEEISNTMFTNNKASFGAAIFADNATIPSLSSSVFSYNAAGSGGAIHLLNQSEIGELSHTTFMNNQATANGGAIFIFSSTIELLTSSTFHNNKAATAGAIMIGHATINALANSTITRNSAFTGGGIALADRGSIEIIANSTITQNQATIGGGINLSPKAVIKKLESSIVAANTADQGPDINGAVVYEAFNLIGISKGSNVSPGNPNVRRSRVGTMDKPLDPKLATLTNNGGKTRTHAPLPTSPAIDSGSNPLKLVFDQRGDGFPRFLGEKVDIGAFERSDIIRYDVKSRARCESPTINFSYDMHNQLKKLKIPRRHLSMAPINFF